MLVLHWPKCNLSAYFTLKHRLKSSLWLQDIKHAGEVQGRWNIMDLHLVCHKHVLDLRAVFNDVSLIKTRGFPAVPLFPELWKSIFAKFIAPGGTAQRNNCTPSDSDSPAPGSKRRPFQLNCYWWRNVSSCLPPSLTLCIDELRCHTRKVQPQ